MNEKILFKGNEAFIACRYEKFVQLSSKAINHDPLNYVIYSKRSVAYVCIHNFEKSLFDAQKTMELKNRTSINDTQKPAIETVEHSEEVENDENVDKIDDAKKFKKPYIGMVFGSIDEARNYYEEYGRVEGYKVAEDYIEEACTKCLDIALDMLKNEGTAESLDDLHESLKDVGNITNELLISNSILLDPHVSQTKGRKKDDKGNDKATRVSANDIILWSVKVAQIKKRKCSVCKESGHNKRQSLVDETRELRSEDDDIEPIPTEDIMKN
ncbi:hypothetical protein GIB67_011683 [Kingdonia uniflora]|uniref:Uncharacterized protein n=1 Tax=Kingdonia uniflora TaxID=39325 RepID=A0A7J7LU54_9MAGN|nr:hypothetical protein GIB67_011683 [Kingdonia uniflora]